MKEELYRELYALDDAIMYEEANDRAYTKHYVMLCKKRKVIAKAVKKLERIERRG